MSRSLPPRFSNPFGSTLPIVLLALAACSGPDGDKGDDGSDTDSPVDTDAPVGPDAAGLCQVTVQCPGNILDNPKAPCTMQIVDGAGASQYDGPAGFELRGRSSLTFPKPQYAIELRQYQELPIWPGSTWKYLDDGSDLGTAWREPGYDDSAWSSGPGQLGFGADYLQTEVAPSTTTWLRYEFTLGDRASLTKAELGILRDDGAAVYLNGTEVMRDNLPASAGFDTWATAATTFEESVAWRSAKVDPALLVDGTNVIAVEVHQAQDSAEDMRFDLYFEATGEDASTDLGGMGAEADWILNGQYVDRSLFRNRLAYDLFQAFGPERYATETAFCELELDGDYKGIYTLGEKLERDGDRIDIGKSTVPGDTFVVKLDDRDGFHDNGVGYGTWQLVYPDADPENETAVSAYLSQFEAAVNGPDPAHPDDGIFGFLDLGSAVDWVILQELVKNNDAYRLSVYLYKDEGGKMHFAPWDLDLSMGYPYTDCGATGWNPRDSVSGDYYNPGGVEDIEFIHQMAAVPAFRDALVVRWAQLREGVLSEDAILERIAGYDATLAPAIDANFARWPIQDIKFSTDYPEVVDNWLCPVTSYEEEHTRTLRFLTERLAWIDANIASF